MYKRPLLVAAVAIISMLALKLTTSQNDSAQQIVYSNSEYHDVISYSKSDPSKVYQETKVTNQNSSGNSSQFME